ncbi:MAG: DODA-type extradiol aromatic ring-opening family dioxygenase [Rhodocyclaceae bacterium]
MNPAHDILYISHGGGPLPLLGDPGHQALVECLQHLSTTLRKPSAILLISAHWEAEVPTVTAAAHPELIYDYYGFPPESYEIRYPCAGDPTLARRIQQALARAGQPAELDPQRGLDHGVFVPLKLMYPLADVPCVELSLIAGLDATQHLALGKALRDLDYEDLLVIGSGFSFHNMRAFFGPATPDIAAKNQAFEDWLTDTCTNRGLTEAQRWQRLADWQDAPHARFCHPREEHLLPLHVCYGLAGKAADTHLAATILNRKAGMFHWAGNSQG